MPDDKDKKKKSGGLLNDLAMGLGLKDRDESYYRRTAQTIQNNQGGNSGMNYYNKMLDRGLPQRGGLLSFMGGGNNQGGGIGNRVANVFGYRDMTDMGDGGGRYASGGYYQGGGAYSGLANLGAVLSGQDMGERQLYVDQYIDQEKGAGFAEKMKTAYPEYYQQLVVNAMRNM